MSGRLALGISLTLLAVPRLAAAQELRASPFRGVLIPAGPLAGDADATALELNPGQLALLEGGSWALVADHWAADTPRAGRGAAFLIGAPLFLGSSIGLGVHWLRPTLPGEPERYGKFQLGYGLRLGRGGGLGLAWERLLGTRYGGRDSFTLGLGTRLHRTLAAGLAVRELGRPRLGERRLAREWDAEIALRPFGTGALEAALGARFVQGPGGPPRPHGRLTAGLGRGLALFLAVDGPRDERRPFEEDAPRDEDGVRAPRPGAWHALAGLHLVFDRSALTVAGVGDPRRAAGDLGPGASVVLRGLPARRPPLVAARHVERVRLRGLGDDASFVEAVVRLRRLADDPEVGAVLLDLDRLELAMGRVEELRAVVAGVRRHKPVLAYLATADTREYYLASACDRILVHPAGTLGLAGLAQTVLFYRGALDRLGVNVDLVRIAEYKGAMEPFVLPEHSEPVRENRNAVLDDHQRRLLAAIAEARAGIEAGQVPALLEHALFAPQEARTRGLVDDIVDDQALERKVQEALGRRWPLRSEAGRRAFGAWVPPRVAIVLVDGPIVEGPEQSLPLVAAPMAWADRIVDALDQVRRDGSVRAVVLRVNSPGGSALASDRIARAVARVRGAGKPVIASFGDYAASGGYYVAAPADRILSAPGSITGSIGIYAYKVDGQALLEKLGVGVEVYKRGEHADLFSPYRPWTDEERQMLERQIRHMYQLFLETVAAGRKERGLTAERVDELGRGRVYTGAQALEHALVDALGGVADAIDEAARRGGVPLGPGGLPELVLLPRRPPNPLETLLRLRRTDEAAAPPLLRREGRAAARLIGPLLLGRGSGLEARLPYEMEIR